ncbi:MAG: hypothetical protein ISQ52_00025 [Synechococcus sp. BS307-5m-G38]|nr:hypothetical protein [Synechococcus sp. BS307-5m-G38]
MNEHSSPIIGAQLKKDWRDYLLGKVVAYLEENKDHILSEFQTKHGQNPDSSMIEASGLLDFDVSITLHMDRKSSFGLGLGFFKANLIR